MEIIMDACSIILLAKSSILQEATKIHDVQITEEVYSEVLKGKDKMYADSFLTEKLNKEKKLTKVKAKNTMTKKLMHDFNMGKGEASSIAFALENNKILLATDNLQGRKCAQINNLKLIGSIEILVSLYKKRKISKEKATSSLKKLENEGWFNPYLIEKAKEDLK